MKDELKERIYIGLIAFLLVMGVIGWAKYVDEMKEVRSLSRELDNYTLEMEIIQGGWDHCERIREIERLD